MLELEECEQFPEDTHSVFFFFFFFLLSMTCFPLACSFKAESSERELKFSANYIDRSLVSGLMFRMETLQGKDHLFGNACVSWLSFFPWAARVFITIISLCSSYGDTSTRNSSLVASMSHHKVTPGQCVMISFMKYLSMTGNFGSEII